MRRDCRPYFVKKVYQRLEKFYTRHFLEPEFEYLGKGATFMQPWNVKLFGSPIELGNYANVITTSDHKVRFSIWAEKENSGYIKIGDYCLICPGVRISSASGITIGDNCMLASGAYLTDGDWHGLYNRIIPGQTEPVTLEENVWIGDSSIVCKGVTIGENSIIGAGSVVTGNIPPNSVAAGNPARVVKELDPNEKFIKRKHFFSEPAKLSEQSDLLDQYMLDGNTMLGWLRSSLFPSKKD